MKIEDLKKMIPVDREVNKEAVSFKALCPFRQCPHIDISFVHYSEEKEASDDAVRKMMNHVAREHHIEIED